ncbi:MAG: TetR/AcrR family transcriptional regulator [Acidimicrobiales bacterium]
MTSARQAGYRPSAQRRREALLRAAVEIAGESGGGAVTHRAVAARAGVPPATTSYFFGSITDLLEEAIRHFTSERAAELNRLADELGERAGPREVAERFAALLLSRDRTTELAEIESYLHAARRSELREAVTGMIEAYERVGVDALRAVGVPHPEGAAAALRALVDGFVLSHLACPRPDDSARLRDAMLALFAGFGAAMRVPD